MKKIKCPEGGTTYKLAGSDPVYSDPEFKGWLDPLLPEELAQLEANIVKAGRALDLVTIWKETRIVLDGHNRLDICTAKKLPWKPSFVSFPNTPEGREQALQWMEDHQEGRRNLSDAARAKIAARRRDRVAGMRQKGMSQRAIAEKENVSSTTIKRDIDAWTATGVAVQPASGVVNSKDGIKRPAQSRAERLGIKPPTQFVPKGERMPGDDTEAEKQDKKEARTDPKNGQVKFDWQAFEATFAKLILFPDYLGKAYKANNSKEADALRKELMQWRKNFRTWYQTIAKQKAPKDPG